MSRGRPKLANRLSQKTDEGVIQDERVVSVSENLIVDRQQRRIIEQDNKLINMEQQLQLLKSKQQKGFLRFCCCFTSFYIAIKSISNN